MISTAKEITVYKMIGLIVLCIWYIYWAIQTKNRCRLGIRYFQIIPKDILCDIRVSTYLRKNHILNKLTIL